MAPKKKLGKNLIVIGVTGTPGCGKTSLCEAVEKKISACKHVNVGTLIKEQKLFSEWDDELNCSIFDDKRTRKAVKTALKMAEKNGCKMVLIDFHSLSFLPDEILDKVFVLGTDTKVLAERLQARGYDERKINENIQAEIFMECYTECTECFDPDKVIQLASNDDEDIRTNIETLVSLA